jgi:energy-coupling factor transporter ATP-binding protein EcfA2
MQPGPITAEQLDRFGRSWEQGDHVLITGATSSGKTTLARHVVQRRLDRNGCAVVFVMKLRPDKTIVNDYRGWTRWESWHKRPRPYEDRILLWPKTDRMNPRQALAHQRVVFGEAMDELSKTGYWTIQIDEGLYTCSPSYLNLGHDLGLMHAMGRSAKLSIVTLAQRPAHLPLIVYSSASAGFFGRFHERDDVRRLSEMQGRLGSRDLASRISAQGRRDFMWLPIAQDWDAEPLNLRN